MRLPSIQPQIVFLVLLSVCGLGAPLAAQDPFEIVVYPAATLACSARPQRVVSVNPPQLHGARHDDIRRDGRADRAPDPPLVRAESRHHVVVGSVGVFPERLPPWPGGAICRVAVAVPRERAGPL